MNTVVPAWPQKRFFDTCEGMCRVGLQICLKYAYFGMTMMDLAFHPFILAWGCTDFLYTSNAYAFICNGLSGILCLCLTPCHTFAAAQATGSQRTINQYYIAKYCKRKLFSTAD